MPSSPFAVLVALAALGSAAATDGLSSTVLTAQYRCEGYLCPQWAIDVTREDPLQKLNQTFEFTLAEALPLAPTFQRQMGLSTAFDPATHTFTLVAMSYPGPGLDSFWQMTVGEEITSVTPVLTNVIVPHPDTAPGNPGALTMIKILTGPSGIVAVFDDGTVTTVDIAGQQHSVFASLNQEGFVPNEITKAHCVDGGVLKSFTFDSANNTFLVTTDLASGVVSAPLPVQPAARTAGYQYPIGAAMVAPYPGQPSQLMLVLAGNFDSFMFVDESSGEQSEIIFDIYDSAGVVLECHLGTFDCDTAWDTITVDNATPDGYAAIYFQGHVDPDGSDTTTMLKLFWFTNAITGQTYPLINVVRSPLSFGFAGWQVASFEGGPSA
jgi:hypothetical protein